MQTTSTAYTTTSPALPTSADYDHNKSLHKVARRRSTASTAYESDCTPPMTKIVASPVRTNSKKTNNDCAVVVDIWHPDFWSSDKENSSDHPPQLRSPVRRKNRVDDRGEACTEETSLPLGNDNNCEEEDECSVLSFMSDVTGAFLSPAEETSQHTPVYHQEISKATSVPNKRRPSAPSVVMSVRFDQVTVREYERVLGDNPACPFGPSVAVGWSFHERRPQGVDAYESARFGRRRSPSELMLSRRERERILTHWGVPNAEVAQGVREKNRARMRRRQTVNNLGGQKVEEALQKAKRQVKNIWSRAAHGESDN